jgi:putative ABC transport system substrate-binding protein
LVWGRHRSEAAVAAASVFSDCRRDGAFGKSNRARIARATRRSSRCSPRARCAAYCRERRKSGDIDAAYGSLLAQGARAVIVASGPFFVNQRAQLIALAARHGIPCIYTTRDSPVAGGLIGYGNDLQDAYRHNGAYVARILKGDKAGDLPIDSQVKYDLVINLKTAKALGLTVPDRLMALADEVIE